MKFRFSTIGFYSLALTLFVVALISGKVVYADSHKEHKEHQAHNAENVDVLNVKLHTEPNKISAGEPANLMLHLTDAEGEPFTDLMVHHDRILHVLIVSENLQTIGHVHPEDFEDRDMLAELEGVYTVQYTFPYSGRYILAIDVMTADAEYTKHLYVDVAGDKKMSELTRDMRREKRVVGYTEQGGDRFTKAVSITEKKGASKYIVKMKAPEKIKVGEMVHITYHFTHAGKPVTDLVPFLDAPMHFAIVSNRLDGILHTHGTVQTDSKHDKKKMDSSQTKKKVHEKTPTTGHPT